MIVISMGIDYYPLLTELIFVLLQITLKKSSTKFVYYGFMKSIYHSLHIFYNHWQNKKDGNIWQNILGFTSFFASL